MKNIPWIIAFLAMMTFLFHDKPGLLVQIVLAAGVIGLMIYGLMYGAVALTHWKSFKHLAMGVLVVVYFVGCSHYHNEVSDSCTHGNCKHGWDSKYNKEEQATANLWTWGGLLFIGASGFFLYRRRPDDNDEAVVKNTDEEANKARQGDR